MSNERFLRVLFIFCVPLLIYGCDSLEPDVLNVPDEELVESQDGFFTQPNSPLLINLFAGSEVSTISQISVEITKETSLGDLELLDNSLVKYTPYQSTTSGTDSFIFHVINANDRVVDADTVQIIIGDSIPDGQCLPTAVMDYFAVLKDTETILDVLSNDVLGKDSLAIVELSVFEEPTNGTAVVEDGSLIKYTPVQGYTGIDQFIYSISLDHKEQNSDSVFASQLYALVLIDVREKDSTCFLLNNDFAVYNQNFADTLVIDVLENDFFCDEDNFGPVEIVENSQIAEAWVVNNKIHYISFYDVPTTDSLKYRLCSQVHDECQTATVYIQFEIEGGCTTDAVDDVLILSDTTVNAGFIPVSVLNNDTLCDSVGYEMGVVQNPAYGTVMVENDQVKYLPDPEIWTMPQTPVDTIKYILCEGSECDRANIIISKD
ncbi:MAG: Ig-like domain-containing protein [Bacteroidota bacterium]